MNTEPLRPISREHVEAYERDGVVFLSHMLDEQWIDHLAHAVTLARERPGPFSQDHTVPGESTGYFSDLQMSHRVSEFRTFMERSPVGAIAARLMDSGRVNCLHDAMWVKEPGTTRRTPWHHDQPFYCMEGGQMCVVWIPIDAHDKEASLRFLRGSHEWGKRFRPERINGGWYEGYSDQDGFEPPPEVESDPDRYETLHWDMRRGDCIVFHGLTLHGAAGNRFTTPRRAISLVLVGDDAVYVEREQEIKPSYAGNGLTHGDPIDCAYFPRIFPRATS